MLAGKHLIDYNLLDLTFRGVVPFRDDFLGLLFLLPGVILTTFLGVRIDFFCADFLGVLHRLNLLFLGVKCRSLLAGVNFCLRGERLGLFFKSDIT